MNGLKKAELLLRNAVGAILFTFLTAFLLLGFAELIILGALAALAALLGSL
jgi:hypothetical protein